MLAKFSLMNLVNAVLNLNKHVLKETMFRKLGVKHSLIQSLVLYNFYVHLYGILQMLFVIQPLKQL